MNDLKLIAGCLQGLYEKYNDEVLKELQLRLEKIILKGKK